MLLLRDRAGDCGPKVVFLGRRLGQLLARDAIYLIVHLLTLHALQRVNKLRLALFVGRGLPPQGFQAVVVRLRLVEEPALKECVVIGLVHCFG